MKRVLLSVLLFVIATTFSITSFAKNTFVFRPGVIIMTHPEVHVMFDGEFDYRYEFASPFYFEFGSGLNINTTTFAWDFLLGGLLRFPSRKLSTTIRMSFLIKELSQFAQTKPRYIGQSESNYNNDIILAGVFGAGLNWRLKKHRELGIEVNVEAGKTVTDFEGKGQCFYFAVLPTLDFVF